MTVLDYSALLQQLHGCIGEEGLGHSFSGRGLDEIPLETVESEKEAHKINNKAVSAIFIFSRGQQI